MTCPYWSNARYRYVHRLATFTYVSVHEPAISRGMPAPASRVDQQWGEPLHPPIDRDMIDSDTPFRPAALPRHGRKARSAGRPYLWVRVRGRRSGQTNPSVRGVVTARGAVSR